LIQRGFSHALLLLEDGSYLSGRVEGIINPSNLEKSLGHPIVEARTSNGQMIYVAA
jgi:iron complex transport system ATP-binding protein